MATTVSHRCDHCGESLGARARYLTTVHGDETGPLRIYAFCDDDCREAWLTERDPEE